VNALIFIVLVLLGGAAIAFWIETRFPKLAPRELRTTLIHVGASLVAAQLIVPVLMHYTAAGESAVRILLAIFVVAFPSLTYSLLASIWAIKLFQGMLRH